MCGKKLSSIQIFLLNKKGSATPAILFAYYNWTPSFLLLTSVEEIVDLDEERPSDVLLPVGPLGKGISEGARSPTTPPHVSLHWSSRL